MVSETLVIASNNNDPFSYIIILYAYSIEALIPQACPGIPAPILNINLENQSFVNCPPLWQVVVTKMKILSDMWY